MTGRERLLKVLDHERADRIPAAPFIHVNYVKAFFRRQEIDAVTDTVEVYRHFGFDVIHRNCTLAYDDAAIRGDNWQPETMVEKDGEGETSTTVVHTPKGDLRQIWRTNWVSEYDAEASPVEYLIKSQEDLDLVMEFQPPVPEIDTSAIRRAKEAVGDEGLVSPWVQGAFNYAAYFVRQPDQLMMDALLDPDFYHRLMRYCIGRNKQIMDRCIAAGTDLLSYAGNIASGKMVSEAFYREHIWPYEKELIDHVQGQGVGVIYHNCGYASRLLSAYPSLGMRMYESLTPPPYGDTVLEHALEVMGPGQVLSGNIDQIEFLRTAGRDEIRECVRSILDLVRDRGNFILATTDYFHEETPPEQVHAMADAWRDYA